MEEPIIPSADVPEAGTTTAEFLGRPVLVTRVQGKPRVYLDTCPHLGGPLQLEGDKIVCGWHGAEFGLDGRCRRGPARHDSRLIVLPTRVLDGVVTYVYSPPEHQPHAHEDERDLAARIEDA